MNNRLIKFLKTIAVYFCFFCMLSCTKNTGMVEISRGVFKSTGKEVNGKSITIIPGDTLVSISKKYATTINELIRANKIKPPYVLKPGKKLIIPKPKKYQIKKNDTFYSISKCFGLTIKEIKNKNRFINDKKLEVGKNINLPFYANNKECRKNDNSRKRVEKKRTKQNNETIMFYWPTKGKLIATFGAKKGGRRNDGINILAPLGNPVRAAFSGKVIYRGNELPAWGNLLLIKHKNGWTSAYAHLDRFVVKVGDTLNTGDLVGVVGQTGNVDKHQLHFQIRVKSKPVNPLDYLKK